MNLIKGSFSWLIISNIATLTSLLITLFSGKMLTKEEYGAVGLIMVVINILESFKQLGVKEYLIKTKDVDEKIENIAWSIDCIKGIGLFILACIVSMHSPLSTSFLDLNFYLMMLSFSFLFEAFSSPLYYRLRKEMKYNKLIIHNLIASSIQAIVAISLLLYGFTYQAIIIGYFSRNMIISLGGYLFISRRPRFCFEKNMTKEIINYGGWIFLSGLLFYITSRLDNLVIAKYLPVSELGVYTFIYSICVSLLSNPMKSISNALFPILSKNGDYNFNKVICKISILLFIFSIILMLIVPIILDMVFDKKWSDGYYVFRILCLGLAFNALKIDSYFMAFGKTKDKFFVELFRAVIFLIFLIPSVIYRGINGAAEITLVANILSLLFWFWLMTKRFNKNEVQGYIE